MKLVNLSNLKYIIINTGYSNRLMKANYWRKAKKISKELDLDFHKTFRFVNETTWSERGIFYKGSLLSGPKEKLVVFKEPKKKLKKEAKKIVKTLEENDVDSDGIVVFKSDMVENAFKYLKVLQEVNYCNFDDNIAEIQIFKNKEESWLVLTVDSESG